MTEEATIGHCIFCGHAETPDGVAARKRLLVQNSVIYRLFMLCDELVPQLPRERQTEALDKLEALRIWNGADA